MRKRISMHTIFILILISVFQLPLFAQDPPYYIGKDTKAALEQARKSDSVNYVISYYLGWIYLNEGNRDRAIKEWSRYIGMAPRDGKSIAIRERLTILKMERARENARKDLKQGSDGLQGRIKDNSVAVLNFNNLGTPKYNAISKGLAAMILTDLAKVPELEVVERVRMNALLDEARLKQAGIVRKDESPGIGRMLAAKNVVWGEYTDPGEMDLRIASSVTETIESKDLGHPDARGRLAELFAMEKELVFEILEALGFKKEELEPEVRDSVEKMHTENFDAFFNYSKGLDFQDQGRFAEANEAFRNAVRLDPGFDLANEALISNPEGLVVSEFWEIGEMERGVEFMGRPVEPVVGAIPGSVVEAARGSVDVTAAERANLEPVEMPEAPDKPVE